MMATIHLLQGPSDNQFYELAPQREVVLGRDPTCDVVFPDRRISRRHARIFAQDGGFWIEDLRSVNGVEVNGRKIATRVRLHHEDQVCLHDVVFEFLEPSSKRPGANGGPRERGLEEDSTHSGLEARVRDDSSSTHDPSTIVTQVDMRSSVIQNLKDNPVVKLQAILDITQNLGISLNLNEILPRILDSLFRIFPQTKRGYILQRDKTSGELELRAIKHEPKGSDTVSHSGGLVAQQVMRDGVAFLSADPLRDDRLAASALDDGEPIRAVMGAPLMGPSQTPLGVIHLETHDPRRPFTAGDLQVLISVAFLAGQAVEYTEMHEELLELDRRTLELEVARDLQLAFLPQRAPRASAFQFSHHYRAAQYVAGDYFDYVELPGGRLAVVVGDVAGHGVSSALTMARLCSDVRYALLTTETPAEAVSKLNWQLSVQFPDLPFITQVLCVLDENDDTLTVVNAGHPRPLLRRGDSREVCELDQNGGLPLGLHEGMPYEQFTIQLRPGDLVLLYTDGVTEAMNREGDLYGPQSLAKVVEKAGAEPKHVIRAVLNDVRVYSEGRPFHDDVCLVAFNRRTRI
jgi:phosphoserine phosphatase RsbU/P